MHKGFKSIVEVGLVGGGYRTGGFEALMQGRQFQSYGTENSDLGHSFKN